MLTEGPSLHKWTPAPNEIYTSEVKIDRRGIEVSNADSAQRTVINNTEFSGYHRPRRVEAGAAGTGAPEVHRAQLQRQQYLLLPAGLRETAAVTLGRRFGIPPTNTGAPSGGATASLPARKSARHRT